MLWIIGLIVAGIIVVIMMKRAGRKGRLVRSKGMSPVKMCPDPRCGLPAGKCGHLRRQAEHAAGFHGPRPKEKKKKKPRYGDFPHGK